MGFDPVSYLMGKESGGGGGSSVTVEALNATQNGTYTAPSGKAYSPVTVAVPSDPYKSPAMLRIAQVFYGQLSFPEGAELTIDMTHIDSGHQLCYGGNNCPGYEKVTLTNLPATSIPMDEAFRNHAYSGERGLKHIVLSGNLKVSNANNMLTNTKPLIDVTGGAIDFTGELTSNPRVVAGTDSLTTMSVVPSTIKHSMRFEGSAFSDATLVSIANGLDGTILGQTLLLESGRKAHCAEIVGTVADGVFTIDAGGSMTLTDFITNTKGWTLA